jgi:hypothetical protein
VCKKCWEIIDSTWGFFGDDIETNGILDEAYPEWTCAECEDKEREEE